MRSPDQRSPGLSHAGDPNRLEDTLTSPKSFAVIPAAGLSRRMGEKQKLLLPWGDATLIEHVLRAWLDSRIDRIVLVSRRDDRDLHRVGYVITMTDYRPERPDRYLFFELSSGNSPNPFVFFLVHHSGYPEIRLS